MVAHQPIPATMRSAIPTLLPLLCALACAAPHLAAAQEMLTPVATHAAHGGAHGQQKGSTALSLPFFDDFSHYEGAPHSALWERGDAVANKDLGPMPPTVGVATLDACAASGALHANASTSPFGADTLCSRPLRLDSLLSPQRMALSAADSIYLSFYYLPGGGYGDAWARIGDAPEERDSLVLEFYSVEDSAWQPAWATPGIGADTLLARTGSTWQWAAVPITEARHLRNGFRFRFRNLCSLDAQPKTGMVANCDQWNIDYVRLSTARSRHDSLARDVAFVEKAPTLLRTYQAMPARQFAPSEMAAHIDLAITNRYGEPLSSRYAYRVLDQGGNEVATYDGGTDNIRPYAQGHAYQTAPAHAHPPVSFSYPVHGAPATFTVEHVVSEGYGGDPFPQNDTLRFQQVFGNYYAYDDGMPENGYGLTNTSSRQDMAVRFALHAPDTLTALDLWFNSARGDENVGIAFTVCVWRNNHGMPAALLRQDHAVHRVAADGLDGFRRYRLAQPIALTADTFYIGIEQTSKDYINLGFDRSRPQQGQNFYRTGSVWQQSFLSGSLLLRPCFGASALVGMGPQPPAPIVRAWPNPAGSLLHVEVGGAQQRATLEVFDMQGRMALRHRLEGGNQATLDLSALPAGLYLLQVTQEGGRTHLKIAKP